MTSALNKDLGTSGTTITMRLGYSEHGEDVLLADIFGSHCGAIIDVGAADGVTNSKSYLLELLGWRCMLVEPNPVFYKRIRERREALAHQCVLGSWDGDIVLRTTSQSDQPLGAEPFEPMHAGTAASSLSVQIQAPVQTEMLLQRRRLDTLLDTSIIRKIDVVSISNSVRVQAVLGGFHLSRWLPRVLLVECVDLCATVQTARILGKADYVRFRRTGRTDWYALKSDRALVTAASSLRTFMSDATRIALSSVTRLGLSVHHAHTVVS